MSYGRWQWMGVLLTLGALLPRLGQAKALPVPQKAWRVALQSQQVQGLTADASRSLTQQQAGYFFPKVVNEQDPSFMLKGPAQPTTWMLIYGGLQGAYQSVIVQIEEAAAQPDGSAPQQGWKKIAETSVGQYDYNMATSFPVRSNTWYKVRLSVSAMAQRPLQLYMSNLNLFDVGGEQKKDIWLMLGASIEVQSMNAATFNKQMKQFYGADPALFTLAQGGWRTTELKAALPGFLAKHPNASYAMIHIGGNNVSSYRPYPGNKDQMEQDLREIIKMLEDKGIVPILGRLTYRAYKATDNPRGYPVPGEENGSLPYNTNVYDPLIAQFSPAFYDFKANKGYIDGYNFFKQHPDLLLDGIHLSAQGAADWQQLWVELAGSVVYKQAPACGADCLNPPSQPPKCGNGVVEVGEVCDEGANPTGLCQATCEPGFTPLANLSDEQRQKLSELMAGANCSNSNGATLLPMAMLMFGWLVLRSKRKRALAR